ncbi:MAG: U32 family peptidase [Prevotellaceae bacterium]|jgi:putative protease|nr:U32 family peptidase [Prevotellaceae bacterium]
MKSLELLAPARNAACGKAAIDNGADAVYIGGPQFGAREAAGNTMADVERLANYAHRFYARLYLTLNTVLYDDELPAARRLAHEAWNAGCDAIIVQDMGWLEMDLPPVPLFASTQTHNASPEKVKFLQDAGFRRVILARELSLAQIAEIRKHTGVELEFFIHGALCVCYSGQCYLSRALTGRSANRGACAQPCRAAYDLLSAGGQPLVRNKHLLSLRDLNLTGHLEALAAAGITSFKIEGRLKNESYVKNVVAHYRRQIDALLHGKSWAKTSSGSIVHAFEPAVERSFSRGFTDYFLNGRNAGMFSHDTGKATGQAVGSVTAVGKNEFTYAGEPLHNADGICFFDARGQLHGTNVNRIAGNRVFVQNGEGLRRHATVYRNFDFAFEQLLERPSRRAVQVDVTFAPDREKIVITAVDEDNNRVSLTLPPCGEPAKNEPAAKRAVKTQLEKSGATVFDFRVTVAGGAPAFFYPASLLNRWRRALAELLLQEREAQRKRIIAPLRPNTVPCPEKEVDYRANVSNALAKKFYERHGALVRMPAFEQSPAAAAELMHTRYCIRHAIGACKKHGGAITVKEPLYLLNNGKKLRLTFDCRHCRMLISEK